jgi:integrase
MRASAVREADVQAIVEAMASKGLAPATIDQAYRVVTAAFRFGKLGADLRDVERPDVRRRELSIPTASDVSAILRAAEGHPMHLALTIAAHTGLRRSEVLALRWSDVELGAGRLRVFQAASFDGRTVVIADTKTKNAKRTVSFGPALISILHDGRREQAARRLALGEGWRDLDLIVDNGDGSAVHPERLSQYFDRLADRLGFEGFTLHALRHFAISTWLRAGVPILVVSRMAGHAKASFTIDTYGHCIPEDQDAAVVAMDRALSGGGT